MIDADFIAERIAKLRTEKNISARDMSLCLGQSQSYINNIENKKALPSMQMFLYICEYLGVTPREFFDEEMPAPQLVQDLYRLTRNMPEEDLKVLISTAERLNIKR